MPLCYSCRAFFKKYRSCLFRPIGDLEEITKCPYYESAGASFLKEQEDLAVQHTSIGPAVVTDVVHLIPEETMKQIISSFKTNLWK